MYTYVCSRFRQADLLRRRFEAEQAERRRKGEFWHEDEFGGQKQRFNFRSEYVKRHRLDRDHTMVWLSFGLIIVVGFGGFVAVKTQVVEGRREQMLERKRLRDSMAGPVGVVAD